jgi:hypothetical protein
MPWAKTKITGVRAIVIFIAAVLALTTNSAGANAQPVDIQGTASVAYDGGSHVDDKTRQQAIKLAEIDAMNRYASNFSAAQFKLYQGAERSILDNIGNYVSQPTIVEEGIKKDVKQYYVVIRTSANTNLINAALSSGAGSAANAANAPTRKIAISFLFAARATASVKQFDARVTSVQGNKNDQAAKQSERLAGGTGTLVSSSSGMSETTTGGNTVLQADQETYSVLSPEDVNAAMSQVFSDSGFDVYDYRDVNTQCGGAKPDLLYSSFSTSDTLSPDLRKSAFDSAKKCQVNTFATGTLDVGLQDTDPVTGQKRVYVSVRMQVNDLSAILPKLLASVGPVQYSGLGPTQDVARRNALINAATEAAKEISNQLKSKGMN